MTAVSPLDLLSPNLEATIATGDMVDVRLFEVREAFSTLFEIQLRALSDNPDIDFAAVVGQPATFLFRQSKLGLTRRYEGVCAHIEQVKVEPSDKGRSAYSIAIVPRLWLLSQRRNYRMFQTMSEPDIVFTLLGEWGIDFEPRLSDSYPTRKYRVQYGESDYHFIKRLLEDVGITFFFEEKDGKTTLILTDEPTAAPARPPVTFVSEPHGVTGEFVTNVRIVRRVRPGRYTQRDVDYRRAPVFPLIRSRDGGLDAEAPLERFHYNPGAFVFGEQSGGGTPVADDRGVHRTDLARADEQVQRRLDAKQGSARVVLFQAEVALLQPGQVLSFESHPRSDLAPDKTLLVVGATHRGYSDTTWTHDFEARFTDMPYRPPLETEKPKAVGVESATVVGPAGEEIHCDEFGRVRVHFHWDRESKFDEKSSCWVPVSQPWGGTGYGGMNIPRVGQEVIIAFLGSDPDRPVIVGRVYTSLQKVPYGLPANKTQSGWRSNSSPGGGGYNELMFEDKAGQELVRFQAEKDFTGLVKNDSAMVVGRDSISHVNRHEMHSVLVDQVERIGRDRTTRIQRHDTRIIDQNLTQHTVNGATIHHTKGSVLHYSDEFLRVQVGAETFIDLSPQGIIIQAPRVDINPGMCIAPPPPPPPAPEDVESRTTMFFGAP